MLRIIDNSKIKLAVADAGGEMMSILYKDAEYLWQGDEKYWNERAINLFPITGRLKDGIYTYQEKTYHMGIHGFIRRTELECIFNSGTKLVFELKANAMTRAEYPFEFSYKVAYELNDNTIEISYIVTNLDTKPIYFCLGGHPGFNVPIDGAGKFSDYYLEFGEQTEIKKVEFDSACLITGREEPYQLKKGAILPLSHELFRNDAIFFTDMSREVTLKSNMTQRTVKLRYDGMKYLGLWHKPKSDAPYLCIEPWSALPSYGDRVDDLAGKRDVITLAKDGIYINRWSIELS